jgi:hypothetical protein
MAIMPLGTGNELGSRLGWGNAHRVRSDMGPYLTQVDTGEVVFVDNWHVDYSSGKIAVPEEGGGGDGGGGGGNGGGGDGGGSGSGSGSGSGGGDDSGNNISGGGGGGSSTTDADARDNAAGDDGRPKATAAASPDANTVGAGMPADPTLDDVGVPRPTRLSCFLSVGYDAHIAHRFMRKRESKPGLASSRTGNKLWHVWYGLGVIFKKQPVLNNHVELYVDGERVEIPRPVRCIHVLNISTTGDGLNLFRSSHKPSKQDLVREHDPQSYGDGKIEVVATTGPMELVKMRMHRGKHALRLAQGSEVRLVLRDPGEDGPGGGVGLESYPMQVEGEPFLQMPGEVRVHTPRHRFFVAGPKHGREVDPQHRRNSLAYPRLSVSASQGDEGEGESPESGGVVSSPSPLRPPREDHPAGAADEDV